MEQSGGSGDAKYKESDQKVDISIQCKLDKSIYDASQTSDLEEDLRLAKKEIVDLKEEKKQLKAHNDRKHRGYEEEYEELLKEASRIKAEMVKALSDKDF